MALLVLMLHYCGRDGEAGLVKLHVLNWASRKRESRRALLTRIEDQPDFFEIPLRFDPAFNRAIDLARGEGLVTRKDTQAISLTATGRNCADELVKEKTVLDREKGFLKLVGKKLTNKRLKEIVEPKTIW